ncbi:MULTISPECIES: DNA recombination protein RmuC [unclassified Aureimonas]|uniref:DNA recombination protein RmuC n=1 Tax=unclassified Aureimonas TaxID=2615206 RepID=UPI0006F3121F|nr:MULTISPECIES: DNA recombination protein RmuC [unclassified Aureimonas]KQT53886.1 DNA recombinase [Aureimonas sp. Leaf427]KQT71672.1 DNA recombinase [Aureimonas sp. Leaf460]
MDLGSLTAFLDRSIPLPGGTVGIGPALASALAVLLILALVGALRGRSAARQAAAETADRLDAVLQSQAEITGRMQTMAEILGTRQADLTRTVAERLDGMSSRVGQSILETTRETKASLSALSERLAVIDRAQGRISDLAGEVVRLQDILSNKQARGAFGQGRMEAIVADALPPGAFTFQATLSNGRRPDCLVHMPNRGPALVIDAKFPLEAWSAFRDSEADADRQLAAARLRRDMDVHARAIAERYLLPGETQDTAFLFVPSESIFAELHEHFADIVQKAQRLRVVIVSPALLMLSIQVVQSILKDARMRQEAGRIQSEVRLLMEDVGRLDARVAALKTHFGQTGRDIDQILISTEKLIRRGERIAEVELGPAEDAIPLAPQGQLVGL